MPTAVDSLLLKFRSKDGRFGVTCKTGKALASQMGFYRTAAGAELDLVIERRSRKID